jgi:hypothetical protein
MRSLEDFNLTSFQNNMQKNFGDLFGFEIQSLKIEKIQFADKVIQKQL